MRPTYLLLSVAVPLASALVIPDETVLAESVAKTHPAGHEQDTAVSSPEGMGMVSWWAMMKILTRGEQMSAVNVEKSLLGIPPAERGGWRRDMDWPDDDYPGHGDWPGHGGWGGHGDWPDDDWHGHHDWPGHDDWPEHGGWGRHGDSPDDEHPRPGLGDWPGREDDHPRHGDWPGHDDDDGEEKPWPYHPRSPHWGHGSWPGYRDDHDYDRPCHRYPPPMHDEPRHRPIDACPGSLCRPERTIWELVKESEHTSRLAELIAGDHDLVDILNSTESNYTIFALTNHALERLPRGRDGLSRQATSSLLRYHIVDGKVSIDQVLGYQTLSTKLRESALGSKMQQRIVVREHRDRVVLNRRSLVVGVDMVS
jgi:hypothetical protein